MQQVGVAFGDNSLAFQCTDIPYCKFCDVCMSACPYSCCGLCICICVYVCACMCMPMCVHVCACVHACVCVHVSVPVCVMCVCMYVHMCACLCVCMCLCVCVCVCVCVRVCVFGSCILKHQLYIGDYMGDYYTVTLVYWELSTMWLYSSNQAWFVTGGVIRPGSLSVG